MLFHVWGLPYSLTMPVCFSVSVLFSANCSRHSVGAFNKAAKHLLHNPNPYGRFHIAALAWTLAFSCFTTLLKLLKRLLQEGSARIDCAAKFCCIIERTQYYHYLFRPTSRLPVAIVTDKQNRFELLSSDVMSLATHSCNVTSIILLDDWYNRCVILYLWQVVIPYDDFLAYCVTVSHRPFLLLTAVGFGPNVWSSQFHRRHNYGSKFCHCSN